MDSADASATALDAGVAMGQAPDRSRLERAAAAWEYAVDVADRMSRKVAKLEVQLADAQDARAAAEQAKAQAAEEFDQARAETVGGAS